MLPTIQSAARRAVRAWRRARALDAALVGACVGLVGLVGSAVYVEVFAGGLEASHLPWLLGWFALVPVGAAGAAIRPVSLHRAAAELDRRSGLHDRIGTALEFSDDVSAMAVMQRADAAAHAKDVAVAAAFPLNPARRLAALGLLAGLALLVVGAALTFRLGPAPPAPPVVERGAAEDLLAAIDRERDLMDELGDKEAVRLLTDLERTIRRIQAREEDLREVVERRRDRLPPEPEEEPDEPDLPEPEVVDRSSDDDLITAEDLARLEEETLAQLAMTDAQERELVSQLFDHTRTAKKLLDDFEYMQRDEVEASHNATDASAWQSEGLESADGNDYEDAISEAFSSVADVSTPDDPTTDIQDVIQRDLSAEAQIEHDAGHDRRESFNQFLQEFVKDVRDVVADAAMGRGAEKSKKKKKGRDVSVDTGDGVVDKTSKMEQSGFEEMSETKRHEGGGTPEEMSGNPEDGMPSDGEMSSGPVGENAVAMAAPPQAGTSAGASGAGTGNPDETGGLATLLDRVVDPEASGPLEQALSRIAEGRLPPEQREAIFDRIARHKISAGPGSEADDAVIDYFAEAEELMVSNRDGLPPLFRDYAHTYFEAIRPGADDSSDTTTQQ